eukprot:Rhum_TRINITY_DN14393_c11_g1::Rhum_TRINITY_DN14393_c11_g1_i1::g.80405::m.80405
MSTVSIAALVRSYPKTMIFSDRATSDFLASLHPDEFQDIDEYDVFQVDIDKPTVLGLFNKMVRLAAEAFHREIPRETLQAATYEVETATQTLSFSPFNWGYDVESSVKEIMIMVSRKYPEVPFWNVAAEVRVFAMTV